MNRRVLGLDLSLTCTGVAQIGDSYVTSHYQTFKLKAAAKLGTGHERLEWLLGQIWEHTFEYSGGHLIVVEGPSYNSKGAAYHQIAGLWWLVVHGLWHRGHEVAIAPPGAVKKYATGKGGAGKDAVLLATARRFPDFTGDNNEADALWLAAMGADHLGEPVVAMPAAHRAALDAVKWPEMGGAE